MIIRAKTFLAWMRANFSHAELKDIARYGADTGWYGLTWYSDTGKLYNRFKKEIWDILSEDAEAVGDSPLGFLASVSRACDDIATVVHFENLMTWYAAERTARVLTESEAS